MGKRIAVIVNKLPSLFLGLFLFAIGISLTLKAELGLSPWGVFQYGLTNYIPITFGQASQLVGLVLIVSTCFIKVIPGLSSVFNMYFIGLFIDLIIKTELLTTPTTILGKLLMLIIGMVTIAWASYFYLRVELGAGPRDGVMEGLVRLFQRPVWQIRTGIDLTVLAIGYLLGGPIGIGTIILSLGMGTVVQQVFKIGRYNPQDAHHMDFLKMVVFLKGKSEDPEKISPSV